MGKGKRLKAERRAAAGGKPLAPPTVSTKDPIDHLFEAVIAIGDAFDTDADCASAAALLREAGRLMGYTLTPRAVSAIVRDYTTDGTAVMGEKALRKFPAEAWDKLDRTGDFENGHLVLTSEDPRALFDPNLRQVGAYGMNVPSVVMNVRSTHPDSGEWVFCDKSFGRDLEVLYILDEQNHILVDAMEEVAPRLADDARTLVDNLRDGVTVEQLQLQSAAARARRRL